jgi:hypothetical protein
MMPPSRLPSSYGLILATALACVWCLSPTRAADVSDTVLPRGWVHLNGYSHHFTAKNCNDQLLGVGATWYTKRHGRVLRAWEADVFQDSAREPSAYIGHSWTRTFRLGSLGVTGALMYHRNFASQNEWRLLPVALPFAETRLGRVNVRAYYVPPVRNASDHQVALQVLVPLFR